MSGLMRLTREVRAPKAPAGGLHPGIIEESVARDLLGEDFALAIIADSLTPVSADEIEHGGWPTARHAEKARHYMRPITRAARYLVRCSACGYAADSACETEAEAIASVGSAHDKRHTRYKATVYPR